MKHFKIMFSAIFLNKVEFRKNVDLEVSLKWPIVTNAIYFVCVVKVGMFEELRIESLFLPIIWWYIIDISFLNTFLV